MWLFMIIRGVPYFKLSLFYLSMRLEWSQVHYYCGHYFPIFQPKMTDDGDDDHRKISGKNDWQRKRKYSEETCHSAALCITHPIWLEADSNQSRRLEKPATNRLSYGTAHIMYDPYLSSCGNLRTHDYSLNTMFSRILLYSLSHLHFLSLGSNKVLDAYVSRHSCQALRPNIHSLISARAHKYLQNDTGHFSGHCIRIHLTKSKNIMENQKNLSLSRCEATV
jgi:hypothetical protein